MTSLPPLPTQSQSRNTGGVSAPPSTSNPPSAFSGGLSSMMSAMQQIEAGYQMLARQVPSLATIAAQHVSALRVALPSALAQQAGAQPPMPGADAGMGGMNGMMSAPPSPTGSEGMF